MFLKGKMNITVVVPIYRARCDVIKNLKSLKKALLHENVNVLIIDDCSCDFLLTKFLKQFVKENENFELIENKANLGYLKTCNFAYKSIEQKNADVVVFLNSDTIVPKSFIKKIKACFNSSEKIALASPLASFGVDHFIFPYYPIETMNRKLEGKPLYPDVKYIEGFCLCVRKKIIDEIGLFDEIFNLGYYEEIDLCIRAKNRGYRAVLIDDLYLLHKRCASFKKGNRDKYIEQNEKIILEKYGLTKDELWNNSKLDLVLQIEKERFPILRGTRIFLRKIKNFLKNKMKIKIS